MKTILLSDAPSPSRPVNAADLDAIDEVLSKGNDARCVLWESDKEMNGDGFWKLFHMLWHVAAQHGAYSVANCTAMKEYVEKLERITNLAKLVVKNGDAMAAGRFIPTEPDFNIALRSDFDQWNAAWQDLEKELGAK